LDRKATGDIIPDFGAAFNAVKIYYDYLSKTFTGKTTAMQLFKSKPSLADGEKARIEFHLQQIAESITADRLTLIVLSEEDVLTGDTEGSSFTEIDSLAKRIGQHLSHDVGNISIVQQPQELEKCGSGGG